MDWIEIALVITFSALLVVEAVALARGDRPITGAARTDARAWLIWPTWYPITALVVGVALGGLLWAGGY